jgi:N6-L-threonylcarbamoyladenine synthase
LPDTPLVLAFDTSAAHCAAALLSGQTVLGAVQHEMQRGQAEALMGICDALLADHGKRFRDLTAIGVGVGPGNFTGIRISVSAARGLALGLGIPAIGVNAFDALRYGVSGPCACAVDARREQVYFQAFDAPEPRDPVLCDKDALPAHNGPLIGATGQAPAVATAVAIAHLCRDRMHQPSPRPSPLYLRPADAAPARDAPPVLLA